MHGGFFLGSKAFYQALRDMPRKHSEKICMSSIGQINQLDFDVPLYTAQRQHARFINTGMMVTLSGAVVSDGLERGYDELNWDRNWMDWIVIGWIGAGIGWIGSG